MTGPLEQHPESEPPPPGISYVEGEPPPPGHVLAQDQYGRRWWITPQSVSKAPPSGTLTSRQLRRIAAFKEVLAEHDTTSLEEAIENFRRDRNPEAELRTWERIADVYRDELSLRPRAEAVERQLLYRVVVQASFSAHLDDVVSTLPHAKGLSHLERVIGRYRDAMVTDGEED